jgi:26S proteasome regulatory subunit N5
MADNRKQEKDFTKEVDTLLPQADAIIKVCHRRGRVYIL